MEVSHRDNTVVILNEFTNFDDEYHIDTEHTLKDDNSEVDIKANLERSYNTNPIKINCSRRYEELITVDEIQGSEDGCFVRSLNITISFYTEGESKVSKHPFYKKNILWGIIENDMFSFQQRVISVSVFLIDNEQVLKPLYTVLANKVVAIIPKINLELKSGLYINGLVESTTPHANSYPKLVYLTIDEVTNFPDRCPIMLWSQYTEAIEYSVRDLTIKDYSSYKEKIAKAKIELQDLNEKLNKEKAEAEKAKAEAEKVKIKNDKATLWITSLGNIGKAVIILAPIAIALYKLKVPPPAPIKN
jgi:hypothetical protein